jgi:biotin carboxylase
VEQKPAEPARRLLVLGAGAGQLGLLAAARDRGLFVIAVDRDPGAPGFRYADRRAILSLDDEPVLERLAEAERVDSVIAAGGDQAVGIAARIAFRFGLRHPLSPEAAVLSSSKVRQRERFLAAGVRQVRWKLVTAPGHDRLSVPCIVKAADRQGRHGLSLVRSREELAPAVQAALRASRSGHCLVEELAEGPEVTVSAFSTGGVFHPLGVTDRLTAEAPSFGAALAYIWPGRAQGQESVLAIAERAAQALGIEEGPTHTRLRLGSGRPRVIELAARLGDWHDPELFEAALGVDLNGLALDAALGEEIRPERLETRLRAGGACVRFLLAPNGGQIEAAERAEGLEGVERVWVYRTPEPAGAVLATGDGPDQALERATRAAECVRFRPVDAEAQV